MDVKEIGWEDPAGIDLVQERGKWRAFVNTAMNFGGP